MATTLFKLALCSAVLGLCLAQSTISHSSSRLEEPQQTLEEVRAPPPDAWIQQNFQPDKGQSRLDTNYIPAVEARQFGDRAQVDQAKDDMKTDELRFWGYRPYYGRRWGGGWNLYPSWGWGWNVYRGWNDYGYGRRYPYYGYYW